MAAKEQNFQNHGRTDPWFHGVLFIGALILLAGAIYQLVQQFNWWAAGRVFAVLWAIVLLFKVRLYALKVQDRVIRLEERLRLSQLLAEPLRARIPELTEKQLIALRFAPDAEVPELVEK